MVLLYFALLRCITFEFGGSDPWILTRFLGPLFSQELCCLGHYQIDNWRSQSLLLKARVVSSLCILHNALRIFSFAMSWSLQPRLGPDSHPRIVFTLDQNDFYWELAFLLTSHSSQIQNLVIEALQKYIWVPSIFSIHCCCTVVSLIGNAQRRCSWFLKLRGASESKLPLISFSHL